jgi:dTDP-4-dehydrorhamnose 3,5-epimerase
MKAAMHVVATALPGVFTIDAEPVADERGSFVRIFDAEMLADLGLESAFGQVSASWNRQRGTLRGIHYQEPPAAEAKIVRCSRGAVFDVAVDLRPTSERYLQWVGVPLDASEPRALYIARGFGHAFVTLADNTEVTYHISDPYRPDLARGVRYDDPAIGIAWPLAPIVISERDRSFPLLTAERSTSDG